MESLRTYKDFLSDENFVLWRLTREAGLEEFWQRYITENPDNTAELTKAANLIDKMKPRRQVLCDEEKRELLDKIKKSARTLSRKRRIRRWSLSAAACLILLMAVPVTYNTFIKKDDGNTVVGHIVPAESIVLTSSSGTVTFEEDLEIIIDRKGRIHANDTTMVAEPFTGIIEESWNTLVVPYGRRSKIRLSDGTQVWVNSGSSVSFPTTFTPYIRRIEVTGEVYLEVSTNRNVPFIVNSPEFDVRVYGTSFNLSAFEGQPGVVVLAEGKISVTPSGMEEVEINPSEKIEITREGFVKEKVNISQYTSWKDGYLIFNDTSMEEVLNRIGRYYNIAFDTGAKGLGHIKCYGNLYLSTDIVNVMHTVSILSSSQFSQKGKTYYLKFDGKDETI